MICALLSWFDEQPQWLADLIETLPSAGVEHVVAVDGGYELFPGARPRSDDKEHRHLIRACKRANLPLTMHVPAKAWETEMEKRTFMFRLAETVTTEDHWYFVVDGDERVTMAPPDLRFELANTDLDCAEVTLSEPHPQASTKTFPMRMLFRAIRGLHAQTNHYTYMTADGRKLWGRGRQEPALDLTEHMTVEHRTFFRSQQRKARARDYYQRRDGLGVEIGDCEKCGQPGVKELPWDWALAEPDPATGQSRLSADWITVCADCEPVAHAENREAVKAHGLDYDTIQVTMERVPVPKVAA